MVKALFLWPHLPERRQIDRKARSCGSPRDTETAGCPLGVTIIMVIVTHVVVAVLDGQDIGSTVGPDMVGVKVESGDARPLPIIRDRGALPPPLRFVVAPHLQDGSCHPHARSRRREGESLPMQVSRPVQSFVVVIFIPQTNSRAIARQGIPRVISPEPIPNL